MNKSHNSGYVGLLVILITAVIITYFMIKQFESYGVLQSETSTKSLEMGNSTNTLTPIQRAKDVKKMVEERSLKLEP